MTSWWCFATGQEWEWTWRFYPGVWLFMLTLIGGYWWLARGARGGERMRALLAGGSGLLLIWILLDWPVGTLGAGYLVSVHALQFLGLAFIAPPLLLIGVPARRWAELETRPRALSVVRAVTHPIFAAILFNLVVLTTHLPSVVDTLMAQPFGAFLIDFGWLASGLIFWWFLVAPVPVRAGGPLARIVYLFLGSLVHTALGMWLLLSRFPVYGVYELAPPIGGRSALADQGLAGGIMELVGGIIIISTIAVIFFRWVNSDTDDVLPEQARP